jgi:hypothetical protein
MRITRIAPPHREHEASVSFDVLVDGDWARLLITCRRSLRYTFDYGRTRRRRRCDVPTRCRLDPAIPP